MLEHQSIFHDAYSKLHSGLGCIKPRILTDICQTYRYFLFRKGIGPPVFLAEGVHDFIQEWMSLIRVNHGHGPFPNVFIKAHLGHKAFVPSPMPKMECIVLAFAEKANSHKIALTYFLIS